MKFVGSTLKYLLKFLFLHFSEVFKLLNKHKDHITVKHLLTDFAAVLRSVGMLLFLNLFILFAFIFLPQGKDILLIVSEDVGADHKFGSFIWLLLSVVLWSIFSEFACRYSIYVTDNSGKSLSYHRVQWRKGVQNITASLFLMLPFLIVLIGFFINWLNDKAMDTSQKNLGFLLPALIMYLTLNFLTLFYYNNNEILNANADKIKENKEDIYFNIILEILKFKNEKIKKYGLTAIEKTWCGKLMGIYEDYTFIIRKPTNFTEGSKEKDIQEQLCNRFLDLPKSERDNFPQNPDCLDEESIVPKEFIIREFTDDDVKILNDNYVKKLNNNCTEEEVEENSSTDKVIKKDGVYRWNYIIPNCFYCRLHKQLFTIVGISVLIFTIICLLHDYTYQKIGSPGLLMLAISCWTGIYLGLLYLDFAVFRSRFLNNAKNKIFSSIPLRLILVIIFFINCFGRRDHFVRYNDTGKIDNRPGLKEHFTNWAHQYLTDTSNCYLDKKDSIYTYPVIFVCAEGGALRTGAYTSLMLSHIQDTLLSARKIDFKKSMYAFSGVSGGSLGVSFFNSIAYLNNKGDHRKETLMDATKVFYNKDFLAPVIAEWLYGDILNMFLPFNICIFDRARAIEQSWEMGYQSAVNANSEDYFSHDFLSIYKNMHPYPALFINTTEVETGRQCWISNVRADTSMCMWDKRDILNYKIRGGINFSTAINFSTRFPFVSPAAAIEENPKQIRHYVDGGYVENTGSGTLTEILQAVKPVINYLNDSIKKHLDSLAAKGLIKKTTIKIVPYVLALRFNEDGQTSFHNIGFANDLTEIMNGLLNTRGGNLDKALFAIQKEVGTTDDVRYKTFGLGVKSNKVPMNWVLSDKSISLLYTFVKTQFGKEMYKLFYLDTIKYVNEPKINQLITPKVKAIELKVSKRVEKINNEEN